MVARQAAKRLMAFRAGQRDKKLLSGYERYRRPERRAQANGTVLIPLGRRGVWGLPRDNVPDRAPLGDGGSDEPPRRLEPAPQRLEADHRRPRFYERGTRLLARSACPLVARSAGGSGGSKASRQLASERHLDSGVQGRLPTTPVPFGHLAVETCLQVSDAGEKSWRLYGALTVRVGWSSPRRPSMPSRSRQRVRSTRQTPGIAGLQHDLRQLSRS